MVDSTRSATVAIDTSTAGDANHDPYRSLPTDLIRCAYCGNYVSRSQCQPRERGEWCGCPTGSARAIAVRVPVHVSSREREPGRLLTGIALALLAGGGSLVAAVMARAKHEPIELLVVGIVLMVVGFVVGGFAWLIRAGGDAPVRCRADYGCLCCRLDCPPSAPHGGAHRSHGHRVTNAATGMSST